MRLMFSLSCPLLKRPWLDLPAHARKVGYSTQGRCVSIPGGQLQCGGRSMCLSVNRHKNSPCFLHEAFFSNGSTSCFSPKISNLLSSDTNILNACPHSSSNQMCGHADRGVRSTDRSRENRGENTTMTRRKKEKNRPLKPNNQQSTSFLLVSYRL